MKKRLLVILLIAVGIMISVPLTAEAQVPTFNTVIATPTGSQPWQPPRPAAVGDFNGDGKMDALIVDGTASARFMYGNGNGTFTKFDINAETMTTGNMVNLPASLAPYMPKAVDGYVLIKAADVNGDGKLDAVCVTTVHINWGPYSLVTVLINTGNDVNGVPQFFTTNYFLGFYDVRSLTTGDLYGDGKPEFVVGSAYAGVYIYKNNGDGTFTPGQVTSIMPNAGGPAVGAGVITDVNGDGKADFVVTSGQANATDVFLGNGDGTLQAPSIVSPAASCIAVADLNKDGKPDLIEGLADGSVSVYLGNGNGTFGSPANFASGATSWPSGFFISDVNGDGNLDVAASLYNAGKVAILTGNGQGTLSSPSLFGSIPNAVDVTLADFTGDGKPDIASVSAAGYGGQNFDVLTNTIVTVPTNRPPVAVAGSDQSFTCVVGSASVTLDGRGSTDADNDPLTYSWSLGGNVVSTNATFTTSLGGGTHTFTLTVSDGKASSTDDVVISVQLDVTPPTLTVPADTVVTANTAGGYSGSIGTATAQDGCSGVVQLTSDAPTKFPLGETVVHYTATDLAGNTSTGTQKVTVKRLHIVIDIKPESDKNPINLKEGEGVIPVAVLSTPTFDATKLNIASLAFGPAGAHETHLKKKEREANDDDDGEYAREFLKEHTTDVNKDKLKDLILHFRTNETGITKDDVKVFLFGLTLSGIPVEGSDKISIVGKLKKEGLETQEIQAPAEFKLSQNFPNPFNPATIIRFSLEKSGLTILKVYDALGREVATLVNEELESGKYYEATFDASSLTSGMYFVRIQSGHQTTMMKMVLMK